MQDPLNTNIEESAGVAVIRNDAKKGPCLLTLLVHGKLDLPKGHIEQKHRKFSNPILACAADELKEESGLNLQGIDIELHVEDGNVRLMSDLYYTAKNMDKKSGKIKKFVYIFAGETETSTITILPNPKSGILEHDEAIWVPIDKVESSRLHEYLKPAAQWAIEMYRQNQQSIAGTEE